MEKASNAFCKEKSLKEKVQQGTDKEEKKFIQKWNMQGRTQVRKNNSRKELGKKWMRKGKFNLTYLHSKGVKNAR